MKLKRSLGQVFLKDKQYIRRISEILPVKDEIILEIGPGSGLITGLIFKNTKKMICIEKDPRFYALLKGKFKDASNLELFSADILKFIIPDYGQKIIVFGNVPYFISTRIIKYLISFRTRVKCAYITLQKEFTDKLLAKTSEEQYGFLTCYTQYYTKVKKLFDIPALAFFPVPKVNSTFLKIDFHHDPIQKIGNEDFLFEIIRQAFLTPRKKIRNTLKAYLTEANIGSLPESILNSRPKNISLREYIAIANCLN